MNEALSRENPGGIVTSKLVCTLPARLAVLACLAAAGLLMPASLAAESYSFHLIPPECRIDGSGPGELQDKSLSEKALYAIEARGMVYGFRILTRDARESGGIACRMICTATGTANSLLFLQEDETILEGSRGTDWKILHTLRPVDGSSRFLALGREGDCLVLMLVSWDREPVRWTTCLLGSIQADECIPVHPSEGGLHLEAAETGASGFVWAVDHAGGTWRGIWRYGNSLSLDSRDPDGLRPVKTRIFTSRQDPDAEGQIFCLAGQGEGSCGLEVWKAGPGPRDPVRRISAKQYALPLTALIHDSHQGNEPVLMLGDDLFLDLEGNAVSRPSGLPGGLEEFIRSRAGLTGHPGEAIPDIHILDGTCPWAGTLELDDELLVWEHPESRNRRGFSDWIHSLGRGLRCLGTGEGGIWVLRLAGPETFLASPSGNGTGPRITGILDDLTRELLRARNSGSGYWKPVTGDLTPGLALVLRYPCEGDTRQGIFLIPGLDLIGGCHED